MSLHLHKPIGREPHDGAVWQVVDGQTVLCDHVTQEQGWARILVRYWGDDPKALRAALERLVEITEDDRHRALAQRVLALMVSP